ncbi:hypothetical protein J6590_013430 [Homalodisca vitripennis]|nr:hypothetical protein J6590_013430 [Homalodisca vitripennis]
MREWCNSIPAVTRGHQRIKSKVGNASSGKGSNWQTGKRYAVYIVNRERVLASGLEPREQHRLLAKSHSHNLMNRSSVLTLYLRRGLSHVVTETMSGWVRGGPASRGSPAAVVTSSHPPSCLISADSCAHSHSNPCTDRVIVTGGLSSDTDTGPPQRQQRARSVWRKMTHVRSLEQ